MIYIRWQRDRDRRGDLYPPLEPDHPCFNDPCVQCDLPLGDGCAVQLVAVCPDPEEPNEWTLYMAGLECNCTATCMHEACVDSLTDDELEDLVMELVVVEEDA